MREIQVITPPTEKDNNTLPSVSVIIPAGRTVVNQYLESILDQKYPSKKIEVIVVSPHQFDPTPKVRFVKTDQLFYPGKMRNIGAKLARGDYLLFLDDDCEPMPDWVKANVSSLKNEEIGAVSGIIRSDKNSFMHKFYDFSNFDLCQTKKPCQRVLCSATLGIRREVFESAGGFDESLQIIEDNDLCLRLNQSGYKTFYDPNIKIIHHHDKISFLEIIKCMFFGGYNANLILARRYPGSSFTARFFHKIEHPLSYLILVAPLTILNTFACLNRNFKEHPKIIFLFPFIFLSKLSHHIGVLTALITKKDA